MCLIIQIRYNLLYKLNNNRQLFQREIQMNQGRPKNKSTENKNSVNNLQNYQRKCITPSLHLQNPKKRHSKSRENHNKSVSTDKRKVCSSMANQNTKAINKMNAYTNQMHSIQQSSNYNTKKQSPFKHKAKSRPISNMNNIRLAKNIDHQLSNLNQSIWRDSELGYHVEESNRKIKDKQGNARYDSIIHNAMEDAKKCMKNNAFEKAINIFRQIVLKDQENIEAQYLLGVSCFHLEKYQECIKALTNVLLKQDHYRKNVYLFLGISYKKQGLIQQSILTLTKAISFYPKYYDALILRAKILSKQKRYYDAIQDLNKCIKVDPQNLQAFISKADCLRSLGQYGEAIILYSQVLTSPSLGMTGAGNSCALSAPQQILLKLSIAEIQSQQIQSAIGHLNKIITHNPTNSEPYLFKGLAYTKLQDYNDAILAYEQSIKYNTSKKATTKALYEIIKLKIEMGDYYGASYMIERGNTLDIQHKILEKVKSFVEGVTAIMKKKYRKGVQILTVLNRKQNLSQYIRPLIYSFRAYGLFCLFRFSTALADLKTLPKLGYKIDRACEYNTIILEGVLASQNNQFKQGLPKFEECSKLRSQLADPYVYCGLAKICEYNRIPKHKDAELLESSLGYIEKAIEKQDGNCNIYYIYACILYELGDYEEALTYVQKAMNKAEDHVMKYLYLHAMIKGILGEIKDAYKGFSSVITLYNQIRERDKLEKQSAGQHQKSHEYEHTQFDKDNSKQIVEAYLNRAKCYLLFEEKKKAFQDLQTYIAKKPLDGQVHSVAGKLLFSIGAFEDAVKAYNYSPTIDKNRQTLEQRMKCYLVLKQLNYCLKDMQKLCDLGLSQIKFDYHCLEALKQASKQTIQSYQNAVVTIQKSQRMTGYKRGLLFKQSDLYFYKGIFKFYLKDYQQSLKLFSKSKNLKALNNQLEELSLDEEGDIDEDQFDNRIYTDRQIQYNIAINQLMLGKQSSRQVLNKYEGFISFEEGQYQQGDDIVDVTPFPVANRLCSIFPEVEYQNKIKFRLSFCLPEVVPPVIKLSPDPKVIMDLTMCSAQPRPDAPWIKRNVYGVVFTDQVVGVDIDLKTEKSLNRIDAIRIQTQQQDMDQDIDNEQIQESSPEDKKAQFKKNMSLDNQLEEKLKKIMKRKQKLREI